MLEIPERVPFRLTQNILDGFGITGAEGKCCAYAVSLPLTSVFRRVSHRMRDHYGFITREQRHADDGTGPVYSRPLGRVGRRKAQNCEWGIRGNDQTHNDWLQERSTHRRHAHNRHQVDLRVLAKTALNLIEKKLRGVYRTSKDRVEKEVTTSNLVQMLIQEATDNANLVSRYSPLMTMSKSNAYRGKCIPVGLHGIDAVLDARC
jgi:serine/threonine-protein kinase ATR